MREAINELIEDVSAQARIERTDVVEMTVVGNPIMQHLVLGMNPVELGTAPFALANDAAVDVLAADIGITINPGGHVYALPCIAGHVGADCAGVLLAEAPYDRDDVSLIVDVGTNAEIIVGNRHRLLAASSPTGPAFEGAQISSGQRAAPGAIERVRIDCETLEPKFKVIGCDLWSDDPLFAERVSASGITGICGSGIIEVIAGMYLAGIVDQNGRILHDSCSRSPRIIKDGRTFAYVLHDGQPAIHISQNDVRAVQLAKAALYAGARLLMEQFGVDKVDRIRLAGAFGAHIDGKYAMVLGLIPDCDLAQVSSAGNAAGTGARIALLDRNARAEIESRVRQIEKIETAVAEGFQVQFVAAMAMPHKTDSFRRALQGSRAPVQRYRASNQSQEKASTLKSMSLMIRSTSETEREVLLDTVKEAYMEVFPTASVESKLDILEPRSYVAITCSPSKGVGITLDMAERLAQRGFKVVPHIAARTVRDDIHLREILKRLDDLPITSIFVPGGDGRKPVGKFRCALDLLREISGFDHKFSEIGIAAHPEGHPSISRNDLLEQLLEKQNFASYLVTQMCFDAEALGGWLQEIRELGITLPAWIGLPGVANRSTLVSTSLRIGVGDSLRYLKNRGKIAAHLLKSKIYRPDELLLNLAPYVADPGYNVAGYHIYCFNQVERAERWRHEFLQALQSRD